MMKHVLLTTPLQKCTNNRYNKTV